MAECSVRTRQGQLRRVEQSLELPPVRTDEIADEVEATYLDLGLAKRNGLADFVLTIALCRARESCDRNGRFRALAG